MHEHTQMHILKNKINIILKKVKELFVGNLSFKSVFLEKSGKKQDSPTLFVFPCSGLSGFRSAVLKTTLEFRRGKALLGRFAKTDATTGGL